MQEEEAGRDVILQRSITLPNDIETIPQLADFIEGIATDLNIGMELTMSLNLAMEEAVVNVMSYAYPEGEQGQVRVDAEGSDQWLQFVISDMGTPFDPTTQKDTDVTLSAEERPIGGLGIFLVRQIMDSIAYERKDGQNILTLRKNIDKPI